MRCALVGHGQSLRLENRSPGADCNPYLAFAAIIAAGLHGIDNALELEDEYTSNAYEAAGKPRLPEALHEAADLLEGSEIARTAFGDEVVEHYLHYARTEQAVFDAAVTDWELYRGFERLLCPLKRFEPR